MEIWKCFAHFFGSQYTLFIAIVVNLTIFTCGISIAWTSPVLAKLIHLEDNPLNFIITPDQSDLIGTFLPLGTALGPFTFYKGAQYFGRKKTLTIVLLPSLIGYFVLMFAERIELYYISRLFIGFSVGGVASLAFSYLSEVIFSIENRGSYLALNTPFMQAGFLASYFVGSSVSLFTFNMLIFSLLVLVFFLLAFSCPDSPQFAIARKGKYASINILKELVPAEYVQNELAHIEKESSFKEETNPFVIFQKNKYFTPFFMVTFLLLIQVLSGISIITIYSEQIFMKVNSDLSSDRCSIIIGIIQVTTALIAPFSLKKFPRKKTLIFSFIFTALSDITLGLYFYFEQHLNNLNWVPLAGLIVFVSFYNFGLDSIPWVFLGEFYPQNIKSIGSAASTSLFFIVFSTQSFIFSKIDIGLLFLGYAMCCFCGLVYVGIFVPETKGKTLQEIQESINSKCSMKANKTTTNSETV